MVWLSGDGWPDVELCGASTVPGWLPELSLVEGWGSGPWAQDGPSGGNQGAEVRKVSTRYAGRAWWCILGGMTLRPNYDARCR
jgi:hypothetical protein